MTGTTPSADESDESAKSADSGETSQPPLPPLLMCIQCGFTYAEFRARGLLGCPACYDHFGKTLFDDMLHVHPALHRMPPVHQDTHDTGLEDIAALRERLSDALRLERYEEAAALKLKLERKAVTGHEGLS